MLLNMAQPAAKRKKILLMQDVKLMMDKSEEKSEDIICYF